MVAETDDRDERTDESEEKPTVNSTLIGWLVGAVHAEIRAFRREDVETDDRLMWLAIGVVISLGVCSLILGLINLIT